ncbi:MAG: amino terminal protease family [Phycisphaerales bacterium]|nr:amino terminal protease family [Phycisphaerales bacterium]
MMIASAVALIAAGVLRPRAVSGPDRVPPGVHIWHLVLVASFAFFVWIFTQQAFIYAKLAQASGTTTAPATLDLSRLSPNDWAFLATIPALAAAIALWAGDRGVGGPELVRGLGLSPRGLPRGIAGGILGAVAIFPPLYLLMVLTEWVYQRLHISHPPEHDLLRVMGETKSLTSELFLILGATVAAPLWEEYMFRGHVQTIIRKVLIRLTTADDPPFARPAGGFPVAAGASTTPIPDAPADVARPPRVWQTWGAIVIASAIFAMVHPMWMWPPIFFLAVGLGYAYERTGNLWTSMTIHCLFNGASTFLYFSGVHGR